MACRALHAKASAGWHELSKQPIRSTLDYLAIRTGHRQRSLQNRGCGITIELRAQWLCPIHALSSPFLQEFESAFSQPTWRKMLVLIIGILLARGRWTVTAAFRQMGLCDASNFSPHPHVLNRQQWSAIELRRRRLVLLVRTFVAAGGWPHLRD
jgi:hypothetical protein